MFIEGIAKLDNFRLDHFAKQVVSLARALTDSRKYRKAGTSFRDVIDQLHHDNGLADARAAEQTNFAAAQERLDQGYLSLQLRVSDLGDITPESGNVVVTTTLYGKPFSAEWSVVAVDPQQEDWVFLTVQRSR